MRKSTFCTIAVLSIISLYIIITISVATAADLTIGNYQLVSSKRIDRTTWEYTYKASVANSGTIDMTNVSASATSALSFVTVISGAIYFGDVNANSSVRSLDFFTIRVNRQCTLKQFDLNWKSNFTYVYPTTTSATVAIASAAKENDVDKVLKQIDSQYQSRYKEAIESLKSNGILQLFGQVLETARLVYEKNNIAKYEIQVDYNGKQVTFYLYLKQNDLGQWSIWYL
jgi:hypothetical protein